jgi:hypothetical protein
MRSRIAIIGPPRSGTSLVANLIMGAGYRPSPDNNAKFYGSSLMNKDGYFEDIQFTLLNDQLIRAKSSPHKNISFLNPPGNLLSHGLKDLPKEFFFDIDERSLETPVDYVDNLYEYFEDGFDWWGISRMLPVEKWHKPYTSFKLECKKKIEDVLGKYIGLLDNYSGNCFLKDPRLTFTMDLFPNSFDKVIWVSRSNARAHLKSLRAHYGKYFLTNNTVAGFKWSSNHFNHKVPSSNYHIFMRHYDVYKNEYIKSLPINFHIVDYDGLVSDRPEPHVAMLEDFICSRVDKKLIRR